MLRLFALIVLIVAILFGRHLKQQHIDQIELTMALADFNPAKFRTSGAFIVGYTGEVGKELVRQLLEQKVFGRLVLIGRRNVDYGADDLYKNVEQKVVDFDNIEHHKEAFEGLTFGFCCLGTTRAKAGADGFVKVDHDYVVNTASVAKSVGIKEFSLVTATNANKDSFFLYPKTKGLAEADVTALKFDRLSIYRPALLTCDRTESRLGERLLNLAAKPLAFIAPTVGQVPTTKVAQAMIMNLWQQNASQPEIIDNGHIHSLADQFAKYFNLTPK